MLGHYAAGFTLMMAQTTVQAGILIVVESAVPQAGGLDPPIGWTPPGRSSPGDALLLHIRQVKRFSPDKDPVYVGGGIGLLPGAGAKQDRPPDAARRVRPTTCAPCAAGEAAQGALWVFVKKARGGQLDSL